VKISNYLNNAAAEVFTLNLATINSHQSADLNPDKHLKESQELNV